MVRPLGTLGLARRGRVLRALGAVLAAGVAVAAAGPRVAGLLAETAVVCVPAAALATLWGGAIALLVAKTDAWGRRAALALVAAMTLAPLHVVATGWLAALGDGGWVARWLAPEGPARGWLVGPAGAAFLQGVAAVPLASLLACAALRGVDRVREEQALLEGGAARTLARVTLAESFPALIAVGAAVALLAAGEITVTDLLRVRTFAEEVYTQAAVGGAPDGIGGPWGLSLGVAALAAAALAALALVSGGGAEKEAVAEQGDPWRVPLRRRFLGSAWLALLVGLPVLVPVGAMVATAGRVTRPTPAGPVRAWDPVAAARGVALAPWRHGRELRVSLALAATVATASSAAAAALAWGGRGRPRAGALAFAVAAALVAVPGPVVGFGVIAGLNQPLHAPLWWLGELYGTWFAPWLAQCLRVAPVLTLLVWPLARRVPQGSLDAARVDGASAWGRGLRVAVPAVWRGLAAAWLVGFALSLGELSATALTVPPGTPPLAVRLQSLLHYGVEDRVAAIGLVLLGGYAAIAWLALRLTDGARRVG